MECEMCGSHQLEETVVEDRQVMRCQLCGHLQGDDELATEIEKRDRADARGIDSRIYGLVESLELVPTFRVEKASAGDLDTLEYPVVFLRLIPGGLVDLEKFLTCLDMVNRETQRRWVVECALEAGVGLVHLLRPRFWKSVQEINETDITEARADLPILAHAVERDVSLGWWRGGDKKS